MKATCWYGKKDIRVEEVPEPKILADRDAIVRVTSTAICGSDIHLYNGVMPTLEKGDVLGHEFMGEVVDVGAAVTNLSIGDRVVVPFPIACGACLSCEDSLFSLCENSNPNAAMAEKLWGYSPAGLFGYSHLLGGYAGGQAEYVRVPYADVGPLKVPEGLTDEQVLFLSDILPTGYMGAEMCELEGGETVAVWGAGPVGQFAIASARLLGAERIIAIDRHADRLKLALERAGATDAINYEKTDVHEALRELTAGRGPDACIDAVGLEAHGTGAVHALDRAKQALMLKTDRPAALRQAIRCCKSGGIVSVVGVYGGFVDQFPMGTIVNRALTLKSGQCHVQRYMRPLLERIQNGDLDPTFVVTHRLPLTEAARGYEMFANRVAGCEKVVLKAA